VLDGLPIVDIELESSVVEEFLALDTTDWVVATLEVVE
jgi:hypothetical protein